MASAAVLPARTLAAFFTTCVPRFWTELTQDSGTVAGAFTTSIAATQSSCI